MTLTDRETTFVLPFYRNLMGINATWIGDQVWEELVTVGVTAGMDDVLWLLRVGAWRQVVMGAWLSLRFRREEIGVAVLGGLGTSGGSLTAPPLAVAAVTIVGPDAAPSLRESKARSDGASARVMDAALLHVGAEPVGDVTEQDRADFAALVAFGARLHEALSAS